MTAPAADGGEWNQLSLESGSFLRREIDHFLSVATTSFIRGLGNRQFDLIFADTWPGKFDHLEEALELLSSGGLYVIDDLLPQANWPDGHAPKVSALINTLEADRRLALCKLSWSSGIIIATRRAT
jgi:predicted O-methyltransferase YrrM